MCDRHLFVVPLVAGLALMIPPSTLASEAPNKEKIDKLIEQLGSASFAEREKASKELAAIGAPALEALRKAAKSDDAEIRKRAEEILPKIERQAESARVLVPKRVKLVYKDTPLGEALADFQKKSGYKIHLHDPDGKLKERKITLDTGETTFWHAFASFCDKAELSEASMEDLMRVPQPAGGAPGAVPAAPPFAVRPGGGAIIKGMPGMPGMLGRNGQLILKDGKASPLPADDRCAVRIRALGKSDLVGNIPEGEIIVSLEVSLEPKLQWQTFQSIHIDKAVDDRDQKLAQVIPQVEGAAGLAGGNLPGGGGVNLQMQMQMRMQMMMARQKMGWSGLSRQVPVQFKKGAKDAKSLKELKGVLTAQLLTEARPVITADKLDKAEGKVFKGDEGGEIKIVSIKTEEKQTTIQLELQQPPLDKVVPAQPNLVPGVVAPPGAGLPGAKKPLLPAAPAEAGKAAQPPAVPQAQFLPGGVAFGGPMQFRDSMNGLSIQDDKGNALPIDASRSHFSVSFVQQANAPLRQAMTWTLVCPHGKDKNKPAKVVYLGQKQATVDIPFALKDVPLP
jgi:hypothetical protein